MNEASAPTAAGGGRFLGPLLALLAACGGAEIPEISLDGMEPAVVEAVRRARAAVERDRGDGSAWGRFGMVLHAHRLTGPAAVAYAEAARLRTVTTTAGRTSTAGSWRAPTRLGLLNSPTRRSAGIPVFSPSLALSARTLEATGQDEAAGAGWEALRQSAPNSAEASLALGRRRIAEGDLTGARAALELVVDRVPSSAAGWSFLSQVQRRLGEREAAANAAVRARAASRSLSLGITADPDPLLVAVEDLRADSRGREARARRASAAGDHQTAEAIYRRLLTESPERAGVALQPRQLPRPARPQRGRRSRVPRGHGARSRFERGNGQPGQPVGAERTRPRRPTISTVVRSPPTLLTSRRCSGPRASTSSAATFGRRNVTCGWRWPRNPITRELCRVSGQLLATLGRLGEAAETLDRALAAAGKDQAAAGQRAGLHFLLADVARQRGRTAEARNHLAQAETLGMNIPPAFRALLEAR